jgi:hypothetical protein
MQWNRYLSVSIACILVILIQLYSFFNDYITIVNVCQNYKGSCHVFIHECYWRLNQSLLDQIMSEIQWHYIYWPIACTLIYDILCILKRVYLQWQDNRELIQYKSHDNITYPR